MTAPHFASARNTVSPQSNLVNPRLTTILFAIMVKRLGGSVLITQADVDDIAYSQLVETGNDDGSLEFQTVERKASS